MNADEIGMIDWLIDKSLLQKAQNKYCNMYERVLVEFRGLLQNAESQNSSTGPGNNWTFVPLRLMQLAINYNFSWES